MDRGAAPFVEEGSQLANEVNGLNVYETEATNDRLAGRNPDYAKAERAMENSGNGNDAQRDVFDD